MYYSRSNFYAWLIVVMSLKIKQNRTILNLNHRTKKIITILKTMLINHLVNSVIIFPENHWKNILLKSLSENQLSLPWVTRTFYTLYLRRREVMVFNATFNNISVMSWWSVLLVVGKRNTQRKPPNCRKWLTSFIT